MLAALAYCLGVSGLIGLSIYAALDLFDPLSEPRHDSLNHDLNGVWGDVPRVPGDLKSRFHDTSNITGRQ